MINKKLFYNIILLAVVIFFSGFSSAYMTSNPSYSYGLQTTSEIVCQPGQDFVIQIAPLGCTPAVVRSDLLEENDVPVLCQLGATKINPLIDVTSIDSISFSGKYSKEVSGIGFYPAKAALGVQDNLNSPVLNNIGYVVIMLKKQPNESSMPNYVTGNLTAKVSYNVNKAFGIGNALFYLPEFATESDWTENKYQFSFWNGKGYLRADNINANSATISIYTDSGKLSDANLQVGQTSSILYLPGFECRAGLKLKLESLDNSDTRVKLRINADVIEVVKGQKFLDNKCTLQDLQNNGIVQRVTIKCQEDSGANTFLLATNPHVTLNIGGEDKEVSLGDWLYDSEDKSVYLGYVGMDGNSQDSKNLFVYLSAKPQSSSHSLTSEELSSVNLLVKELTDAGIKPIGIINQVSDAMKSSMGLVNRVTRYIANGQSFLKINFLDKTQSFLGKSVYITGFSGPLDVELDSTVKEQYNSAKQDYETIITQYALEPYLEESTTYGEEALYNEIALAFDANQKATAYNLCEEFTKDYPNSEKDLTTYCSYRLSNSQTAGVYVTINKQVKKILFDEIYEPTFEEYGVVIMAETPKGIESFNLEKNRLKYLDSSGSNFIQLISINNDNSANVQIGVDTTDGATTKTVKLTENSPTDFAKGYTFTLTKINSKKIAKVSVISNINDAGTTANFSFKIGIEKRAINLSPDQVRQQITDLNEGISKWQNISDFLGNTTKVLKTSCIAAGVALVAKNFLLNTGGAGIARTAVMGGIGGWTQRCADSEDNGIQYTSPEDCYNKNADKIDADVANLSKIIDAQNAQKKALEKGATTEGLFGEQVIKTDKYMQQNIPVVNSYLKQTLPATFSDPSGKGQSIDTNNLLTNVLTTQGYTNGIYTLDQLNEIELYTRVLSSPSSSEELKSIARSRLYSDLLNLQTNAANYAQAVEVASALRINPSQVTSLNTQQNSKVLTYEGLMDNGKPIAIVQTLPDGKVYKVVLDNSAGTSNLPISFDGTNLAIYDYSSGALITDATVINQFKIISFQKFDSTSYKNTYKNAKLTYYETEPYKGMPAIVPFDLVNGWYAATKPVVSNTATNTYDANGKVTSFYVCNVGANGIQEFQTGGDDICEMINTGTGQAYNQFPGLSTSEATTQINKANQAIEAASKAYTSGISGKVDILGTKVDVGAPAVSTPQFQCQDFMSPKDCLLLFNLCDPVICPSSRCDLGGAYPVKDVIQSGVIGSIALCFPNIREGIVLPVCLTGIQAGIDGFLSVQKSYRDCLNESLATGNMIGICDEVYSIYLCDFFWKQALPLANLAIPALISAVTGQSARGGGEYLGVADAWSTAQKSFDYFISSYGVNSKNAFKSRTTEVIQNEVCKLYTSAVVPSSGDLLSTLTQPDSPPQFTGHFEEMTFSTATNPATSQYKIYYHIYAGKDSGVYYQIYLKGDASSSYYQDNAQTIVVDSGYISVGSQVDETKDIIATSGYKKLCINVNGQEECGFSSVSTSFGINYLTDLYVSSQANQTDINSDSECISDYNSGIIRTCATADPGQGTDPNSGTSSARWKQVGYCDTQNMKCWIDTESIENAMNYATDANATINSLSSNYLSLLANQAGYLTEDEFSSVLQEIQDEKSSANKITLIDSILEKILLSNEKSQLLFLRGNAYADIFRNLSAKLPKPAAPVVTEQTPTEQTCAQIGGVACDGTCQGDVVRSSDSNNCCLGTCSKPSTTTTTTAEKLTLGDISGLSTIRQKILTKADGLVKTCSSTAINCWDAVYTYVYASVGVGTSCLYSDKTGKQYTIMNDKMTSGSKTITMGVSERGGTIIFKTYSCKKSSIDTSTSQKFDLIQPGDLLSIVWNESWGHNVIFVRWTDKAKGLAQVFDWNGVTSSGEKFSNGKTCDSSCYSPKRTFCKSFRYYETDLSDTEHPIYVIMQPVEDTSQKPVCDTTDCSAMLPDSDGESAISSAFTGTATLSMGDKIAKQAENIIIGGSNDNDAKFVSTSVISAGVEENNIEALITYAAPSVINFISVLDKSEKFKRVDVGQNLKRGDIIIMGKGCDILYSVAIFSSVINDDKIIFYTNLGKEAKGETSSFISSIDGNNMYFYKAYRYVGDLSDSEKQNIQARDRWTLEKAIEEVNKRKGSYTDNKIFVDQLIFDGILTGEECGDVRGTSSFVGSLGGAILQKDMVWLKKLLLVKCGQNELCREVYLMK
jgi:hypothetical protein